MTNKSGDYTNSDVELIASWREWLTALEAEMSATNARDEKRRHIRVEAYSEHHHQNTVGGTGRHWHQACARRFLDGFDDGGELAVSAYLDTVRMLDRDFLAEAEAVVDRSKLDGLRIVRKVLPAARSRQADRST